MGFGNIIIFPDSAVSSIEFGREVTITGIEIFSPQ